MALIVEDGSAVSGAECYANADAFVTWHTANWGAAPTASTALQEAAIRRAVAYLDALRWVGQRTNGRDQALAWPRAYAVDAELYEIATDEIPAEVIDAQHILTRAEIASPGALSPEVTLSGKKVLTGVKGITWQVQAGPNTVDGARAVVTMAMDRIKGLLINGGSSATQFLDRA